MFCSSAPKSRQFTQEFVLQSDASDKGVGAVLSQLDEDDHPVAFFSLKLLPREKHSIIEKKCLAINLAVQTFCVYLLGAPFIIKTE